MEVFAGLAVIGVFSAIALLLSRNANASTGGALPPADGDDGFDPSTGDPPDDPIPLPGVSPPDAPLGIIGVPVDPPITSGPITIGPLPGIQSATIGTPLNATDVPTRGRYYRIRKGDTLSALAKKMNAADPSGLTNVEWQQFINSANPEFWRAPSGAYYESVFPNGYMGQAFLPKWSGGSTVESNTKPGKKYPAILIP